MCWPNLVIRVTVPLPVITQPPPLWAAAAGSIRAWLRLMWSVEFTCDCPCSTSWGCLQRPGWASRWRWPGPPPGPPGNSATKWASYMRLILISSSPQPGHRSRCCCWTWRRYTHCPRRLVSDIIATLSQHCLCLTADLTGRGAVQHRSLRRGARNRCLPDI